MAAHGYIVVEEREVASPVTNTCRAMVQHPCSSVKTAAADGVGGSDGARWPSRMDGRRPNNAHGDV
eukprot:15445539-Alexandrium_andersonii.AAC.1